MSFACAIARRLIGAAILLGMSACAETPGADGRAQSRDSAGVRIVESAAEGELAVWRMEEEALVEIGGADAGFVSLTGAVHRADGFVAADEGAGELRFYDAQGRFRRKTGRKGRGPGEFEYIGWIGILPGDSLAAWDPLLRRMTIFGPDGGYARDFRPSGLDGFFPAVHGVFRDGTLLMTSGMESSSAAPREGAWRDTMILLRIDLTGAVRDTIGRFPGPSRYASRSADGTSRTHSLPFGPVTSAAVHGDEVFVATGERYEVATYDAAGRLRRVIRHAAPALPVTRRERDAYVENMLQSGGTQTEQAQRRAAIASAPFPRTMAPVLGMTVDDAGNVWVREAQSPATWDALSRWTVLDAEGRPIARVEGPGRVAPEQIGADWMLARVVDADGTERLRLYRVAR